MVLASWMFICVKAFCMCCTKRPWAILILEVASLPPRRWQ